MHYWQIRSTARQIYDVRTCTHYFDMNASIEDFKTGWFGLQISITEAEIPIMIERLKWLQQARSHFHLRSDFTGEGGVGDVEFYWAEPQSEQTLSIE